MKIKSSFKFNFFIVKNKKNYYSRYTMYMLQVIFCKLNDSLETFLIHDVYKHQQVFSMQIFVFKVLSVWVLVFIFI